MTDVKDKNQLSIIEILLPAPKRAFWRILSNGSWRSSRFFIVVTICLATFTDGFIYGIVVPVFPFLLQSQSLVPQHKLQIATSVLTAAFAISDLISAPLCAWYVDHYRSRHLPWYFGLALIATGGILFGVANNFTTFLMSRLLQGASSGILYTAGLAVLVENVGKDEVGQYMGAAMSANNFGIIMSPLLGGAVYDRGGKRAVFGFMIGIASLDIGMRLLMKEGKRQSSTLTAEVVQNAKDVTEIDQVYQLTSLGNNIADRKCSTTPPSHQLSPYISQTTNISEEKESQTSNLSTKSPRPAIASTMDTMSLSLTSPLTKTTTEPVGTPVTTVTTKVSPKSVTTTTTEIRPTRLKGIQKLVRSPRFLAALYGCFINECITASLCAILPLYTHTLFQWSSLFTGLLFLTLALPGLAGPLAGMLGDRLGPKWVAVSGFLTTTPTLIGLMVVEENGRGGIATLIILLTLVGSTLILFLSPLGADLSHVADEMTNTLKMDMFASSFSLMNSALALAGILGPLLVGTVRDIFGWRAACILLGLMCLSGAIPCIFFTGTITNIKQRRNDQQNEKTE